MKSPTHFLGVESVGSAQTSHRTKTNSHRPIQTGMIRLHGKNDASVVGGRCYYTNPEFLRAEMKLITGREPVCVNVTSSSNDDDFRQLSPMMMGLDAPCYSENKRLVTGKTVEVIWQYSKVYCGHVNEADELEAGAPHTFIKMDADGKILGPSDEWFKWRDAAYNNPCFHPSHPEFEKHKSKVRRAFTGNSEIAFWWWDGRMLNRIQARQQIYATLYSTFLLKTRGFERLKEIVARGDALRIFDLDGYDWLDLGMEPADCVRDANHSFGHGLCIALHLLGKNPADLFKCDDAFIPTIPLIAGDNGTKVGKISGKVTTANQGFLRPDEAVINLASEFQGSFLCDGPSFALGRMENNQVVEIPDPLPRVQAALVRPFGADRFQAMKTACVIYSDPILDVAGTPDRVKTTVAICREILQHTHWHIRLQSKNELLLKVAAELNGFKKRVFYGFSIGSLEEDIAAALEPDASAVAKRLKALAQLRADGFQTFVMLTPLQPQSDYQAFVTKLDQQFKLAKCEGVWAAMEADLAKSILALRHAGVLIKPELAEELVNSAAKCGEHAESAFLALAKVVPADKLHFLQPTEQKNYHRWEKHVTKGAVLLGRYPELVDEVEGKSVNPDIVSPLSSTEKLELEKNEGIIRKNGAQFLAVGCALLAIRDRRLYRESHSSFDGYCVARFDFGRSYAYRLIGAAGMVNQLGVSPTGDTWPITSERQARELLKVADGDRVEVLTKAIKRAGRRPLNALWIQQAAAELKKLTPAEKPKQAASAKIIIDPVNFHEWMRTLRMFARGCESADILRMVQDAKEDQTILVPPRKIKLRLNWTDHYDSWTDGEQQLMNQAEKQKIEDLALDILELDSAQVKKCWGIAHPPGCFAQTVIQINPDVRHRFSKLGKQLCLKIFNLQRGKREWPRIHKFHTEHIHKLPGVPHKNIQNVLAVGPEKTPAGERGYLIQEWIEGATLEAVLKTRIQLRDALKILDDLFLKLIIPLWSQGTKWWDARLSNYVFTIDGRLIMIDPDALADYGAEIATTPGIYAHRNSANNNMAMKRYGSFIVELAKACSKVENKSGLTTTIQGLCKHKLNPVFLFKYPLKDNWSTRAEQAYQQFRAEYQMALT